MKVLLPIVVPTTTMLVVDGHQVLAFSSEKHQGRLVFPGGKLEPQKTYTGFSYEEPLVAAKRELQEEVGINADNAEFELFGIACDLKRDVRSRPLGKALDGNCDTRVAHILSEAHFGVPDHNFLVRNFSGEPMADGREAEVIFWLSLKEKIDPNRFGAGQGAVFLALRRWWETGGWSGGLKPSQPELADFELMLKNCCGF